MGEHSIMNLVGILVAIAFELWWVPLLITVFFIFIGKISIKDLAGPKKRAPKSRGERK